MNANQSPRLGRTLAASICVVVILVAASTVAFAHAAVLWAYVENNHVYVEAFFMGGTKVKNGRIVVVDKEGKKLLEGKDVAARAETLKDLEKEDREKLTEELTKDLTDALDELDKLDAPSGKKYAEAIKAGEIEGTKIKK